MPTKKASKQVPQEALAEAVVHFGPPNAEPPAKHGRWSLERIDLGKKNVGYEGKANSVSPRAAAISHIPISERSKDEFLHALWPLLRDRDDPLARSSPIWHEQPYDAGIPIQNESGSAILVNGVLGSSIHDLREWLRTHPNYSALYDRNAILLTVEGLFYVSLKSMPLYSESGERKPPKTIAATLRGPGALYGELEAYCYPEDFNLHMVDKIVSPTYVGILLVPSANYYPSATTQTVARHILFEPVRKKFADYERLARLDGIGICADLVSDLDIAAMAVGSRIVSNPCANCGDCIEVHANLSESQRAVLAGHPGGSVGKKYKEAINRLLNGNTHPVDGKFLIPLKVIEPSILPWAQSIGHSPKDGQDLARKILSLLTHPGRQKFGGCSRLMSTDEMTEEEFESKCKDFFDRIRLQNEHIDKISKPSP